MVAKLKLGKHPDTDDHFWDGSEKPQYMPLPEEPKYRPELVMLGLLVVSVLLNGMFLFYFGWKLGRWIIQKRR